MSLWTSVLVLLQLFCGERADALRRCQASWLECIDDAGIGSPSINIPDGLNRKTVPRQVPIPIDLAKLLHSWMYSGNPLRNAQGQQWPQVRFDEQPSNAYLFPGRKPNGEQTPNKAISTRSYGKHMRAAAEIIKKDVKAARTRKEHHPFESFDLSKLRTHSMKKTAVSLLKEQRHSSAIVASLTGASIRTLETVYDRPTTKRTRQAVNQALGPIAHSVSSWNEQDGHDHDSNFCTRCGHALLETKQRYCSKCGHKLITVSD